MLARDKHRVNYFADIEFFLRWDGDWDIFLDEDLEGATSAIKVEIEGNIQISDMRGFSSGSVAAKNKFAGGIELRSDTVKPHAIHG
ncbi:DNA-damage-repair/toleration protein DRT102 [Platanthera guangdongensis]|uniref:DNA-damage-repair/toleration protein DRT102 n=1 Tax=Platanthera guangdongensis TaxID=2320717 RepID=A0ABR2M891_9ASPA